MNGRIPAPLTADCNASAVRRAARYLGAAYDQALAPAAIRSTQLTLLYQLAERGPMGIKQLAATVSMDRTTLTTNLKPIERAGLVTITAGADRRARVIALTVAGQTKLEEAIPLWRAIQARFEASYGKSAAAVLRGALAAVLETDLKPWSE